VILGAIVENGRQEIEDLEEGLRILSLDRGSVLHAIVFTKDTHVISR
jgi:hypothetical protein